MSKALNEKQNPEPLPAAASAGVILNGRYLPPPEDKDGKRWIRTSALIQGAESRSARQESSQPLNPLRWPRK
jgi:hypothetical protein